MSDVIGKEEIRRKSEWKYDGRKIGSECMKTAKDVLQNRETVDKALYNLLIKILTAPWRNSPATSSCTHRALMRR